MGIRLGGLASGIDTQALIEAIMGVERRPLVLAQNKRAQLQQQQSIFQDLNTRVLAVLEAAKAIDNLSSGLSGPSFEEELLAFQASSSDESFVVATAGAGASAGSYDVRVDALATNGREGSASFATQTDPIATAGQTLTIDHGGPDPIVVDAEGKSLGELRDEINTSPENVGNVRAEILFDGTGYRLIVQSTESGLANDINVTTDITGPGGGAFLDPLVSQDGDDASLTLLGIPITSASNTVSDAIPGVTLELLRVHTVPGDNTRVDVTRDDDAIAEKLQTLVDAYNSVRDLVESQSRYNENTETAGPLSGDSTLRAVERTLRDAVSGVYSPAGTSLETLSEIGVRFDKEGRLSLDREVLSQELDNDANGVRILLSGDGTEPGVGAAAALAEALEFITRAGGETLPSGFVDRGGPFVAREAGFEDRIGAIDAQIARMEERLAKREELLVLQFTQMESVVATLQSQGNSLIGLLSQNDR